MYTQYSLYSQIEWNDILHPLSIDVLVKDIQAIMNNTSHVYRTYTFDGNAFFAIFITVGSFKKKECQSIN